MADPFLGQIMPVGFNFAPRGWALCNGQLLAISQYSALFSLLGTTFGGDGRTTFGLPELRGRSIVHVGTGPGLPAITWGEKIGSVTISTGNMPAHTHAYSVQATTTAANQSTPAGHVPALAEDANRNAINIYSNATPNTALGGATATGSTGSGSQFRNPMLGIYYCIALQGVYPSRN